MFLPRLRIATFLTLFVYFGICGAATSDNNLFGNVTVLSPTNADASSVSVTCQPYPPQYGIRTTFPLNLDLPLHCSTCDRGAPTEYCYHDDGVCVTLSDTSVYGVHFQDGLLETDTHPLADGCTPRYLQRIQLPTAKLVVVCRESCFQLISRSGSTLTLYDPTCGEGQGGIVVEVFTPYGLNLFLVELDGHRVISTDHSSAGPPMDITPADCPEPLSLRPLFTRDEFFLRCRMNDGDKPYILHPYDSSENSLSFDGDPMSSPDGRTFATVSNTTLQVYNTDNLAQYPGVKDFGVPITFFTYLDSDFLIILLDGNAQALVRVFTFLFSAGGDGLTILPYTSSGSPIHKLIIPDMYATSNRTGSVYSVQLFNITNGQSLEPVSNLIREPVNVFFFPGSGLPPPVLQSPSPSALNATPSPSSTPLPSPSPSKLASGLPGETATAKPPDNSKPDKSTDKEPTYQNDTSEHHSRELHVIVPVAILATILAAVMLVLVVVVPIALVMWKLKRRAKTCRPHKQETGAGQAKSCVKLHAFSQQKYEPSPSSSGTKTPVRDSSSNLRGFPGELVSGRL